MVASLRPVTPSVVQTAPQTKEHRQPRWVQDVLPFATSLLLHLSILAVGFALYKAVTQPKPVTREQMTVPDSAMVKRADFPITGPPIQMPDLPMPDPGQPLLDVPVTGPVKTGKEFLPETGGPEGENQPIVPGGQPAHLGGGGPGSLIGPTGSAPFGNPHIGGSPKIGSGIFPPGTGNKVIFLCDASGSMLGVFGALKHQLKDSINTLDIKNGAQFNVIFFSDDNCFPLFKDGMQMATAENKLKAMEFVDNAISTGGTQPLPAIKFAMAEKPDLLYVLTDGFDQISNFDDVTNAFKNGNKDQSMHINCIFLESDPDPKLEQILKQISDQGKGTYTKVRKEDL